MESTTSFTRPSLKNKRPAIAYILFRETIAPNISQAHPRDSMTRTPQLGDNETNLGSTTENQGDKQESTLGKVKDTLLGK